MPRLFWLLGFSLMLAGTRSTQAQTPEPPPPPPPPAKAATPAPAPAAPAAPTKTMSEKEATGEAKNHFKRGVELFNDNDFDGALAEFEAAYAMHPAAGMLYNIGLTQKQLNRYGEAIETLERYLNDDKKVPKERRQEVLELLNDLRNRTATITLYVAPDTATVQLDGRALGPAPLRPQVLKAGDHSVDVAAEGYKPRHQTLTVVSRQDQVFRIELEALPKTGKLHVFASRPDAKVSVDKKDFGGAPAEMELPAGSYRLLVQSPGYKPAEQELVIVPGTERTISVNLELPSATNEGKFYHKWWFWTIVGVVVVGGTVGTVAALSSTEKPIDGTLGPVSLP